MAREFSLLSADHVLSDFNHSLERSQPPAWKRLISDALNTQERVSLITGIFSEQNGLEVAKQLHGEDAQAFVDVIDKVGCPRRCPPIPIQTFASCRIGVGQP